MLKFMLYHTNIMCLKAHNQPKNAHGLELIMDYNIIDYGL